MLAFICLLEACTQGEANETLKQKNEKATIDLLFNQKIDSLVSNKEFPTAIQITEERLKDFPENYIPLTLQMGKIYKAEGVIDSAILKFTEVIEKNEGNLSALVQRGWLFVQQNKFDEAILDFTASAKINPDILFDLGYAFEKKGLTENALNSYAIYLKNNPGSNSCRKKIEKLELKMKEVEN